MNEANYEKSYVDSEISIVNHTNKSLLAELRGVVHESFPEEPSWYSKLSLDEYRSIVNSAQTKLNDKDFSRKIGLDLQEKVIEYIKEEDFFVQSNLYLRATRFNVRNDTESINWHRESFYGPNMERSVNIWTPVEGVSSSNTLRYIPKSQKILDEEILTEQIIDPATEKGSTGNIIGFLYAPKNIVAGVNLDKAAPMQVPYFSSSIFPGNLIHGAATNSSNEIRFSVDFRILPKSAYDPEKSKKIHVSSGRAYFEEL